MVHQQAQIIEGKAKQAQPSSDANDRGQITGNAAEVYEEFFIPALFQEWAGRVIDAAAIEPGWRVLDVACGTGIVARTVLERTGSKAAGKFARVVGLDFNEGMLEVAKHKAPAIEWRLGAAESLPFDSHSFDAVTCQFGLMFFEDRRIALQEMMRVLKPGGHLAVAVWDSIDNTRGYAELISLLQQLFGAEVANTLRPPFALGDPKLLQALFTTAGIANAKITHYDGTARFPSIRSWMYTDVKGWTMAEMIDDAQFERLCREAEQLLQRYLAADGSVAFSMPAYIVTATKA